MKRATPWLALAGITLLLAGVAGAGTEPALLTSVRYDAQTASSKVVLRFDGEVTYAPVRRGLEITIRFPQTAAAVSAGPGTTTRFRKGLIRSCEVQPGQGDTLAVRLMLREQAAVAIKLAATGNCVIVEAAPEAKAGPIDIARATGLAEVNPGASRPLAARDSLAAERVTAGADAASPAVWVLLVIVPGITTSLLLLRMAGRRATGHAGRPVTALPSPDPGQDEEHYPQWEAQVEEHQDDVEERTFQLAKNFNRGTEELDLAFRLQGETRALGIRKEVHSIPKGNTDDAGRLKTAKRLGVGRGEVDLALRLREFSKKHDHGEGA